MRGGVPRTLSRIICGSETLTDDDFRLFIRRLTPADDCTPPAAFVRTTASFAKFYSLSGFDGERILQWLRLFAWPSRFAGFRPSLFRRGLSIFE
jgi:hypothetical protein